MKELLKEKGNDKAAALATESELILPKRLPDREKQLVLALADCVIALFDFNITRNKLMGTPLRFSKGKAFSLVKILNLEEDCQYTTFINYGSVEYEGMDKENFLTFYDINHLQSCFDKGQTHLHNNISFLDANGHPSPAEQHVLLYKDTASGDLMGLGYMISHEVTRKSAERTEQELLASEIDVLTGCYNRATMRRVVPKFLRQPNAEGTFIILDIDNFKKANDIGGHQFGDKVLAKMGEIIRSCFRQDDLIIRLGGDEFAIFLKNINDRDRVREKVQLLLQKADRSYETEDHDVYYSSISVGIAVCPECGKTLEELYRNADEALYRAKALGKNGYSFYKEISEGTALNETFRKGFRDSDCRDILDAMSFSAVHVIEEKTHRILFYNKHFKDIYPQARIGDLCYEVCGNNTHRCEHCPLNTIGDGAWSRVYNVSSAFGECCEMTATRMLWQGKTPAVLMRIWPELAGQAESD